MSFAVNDLQLQRQTLQNQLLLKSSANSAAVFKDSCGAPEKQLADISAKLRTQKNTASAVPAPRYDIYRKGSGIPCTPD